MFFSNKVFLVLYGKGLLGSLPFLTVMGSNKKPASLKVLICLNLFENSYFSSLFI